MEEAPCRKHRRKSINRPIYLSKEVLDKCAAIGEAHLLELIEKVRDNESLEFLLQSVNNTNVEDDI